MTPPAAAAVALVAALLMAVLGLCQADPLFVPGYYNPRFFIADSTQVQISLAFLSSAVYQNELFYRIGGNGAEIPLTKQVGIPSYIGPLPLGTEIIFGIRTTRLDGTVDTWYSNAGGHAALLNLDPNCSPGNSNRDCVYLVGFEDRRIGDEPDRPEAPGEAYDFNDLIFEAQYSMVLGNP